jgi:hypothetical protein
VQLIRFIVQLPSSFEQLTTLSMQFSTFIERKIFPAQKLTSFLLEKRKKSPAIT